MRLPLGSSGGLGEFAKLPSVHKGFQNILLHLQIAVDDAAQPLPQLRKILHRLANAVICRDIVSCRFGAEDEAIADVLLEEALAVVAANHRVG